MTSTVTSGAGVEPGTPPGPGPGRRSRQRFETWSWVFMRVSGLVLVFLALLHFAVTHIINDVVETDAAFVADRWDNPLWRVFDWLLLALALLHGLNGVRWCIDDYVRSAGRRTGVKVVVYAVSAVLFVYGTYTIVTFP